MALQVSNNAICTLQNPIQEDSMVIFLAGNYNRLPTSNFILEFATFGADNETVIARENVLIASRNGNQLIVGQRAYEPVPIDDDASENIQQPLAFEVGGTVVKQVLSKALFDEIQKDIFDINKDLEDNYLTVLDYENEKGQPGGIATLDENGKVLNSEIDTATLGVGSLEYTYTAGENLQKGDPVCVGFSEIVETVTGTDISLTTDNSKLERTFIQMISFTKTGTGYLTYYVSNSASNTSSSRNWTVSIQIKKQNDEVIYEQDLLIEATTTNTQYERLWYENTSFEIEAGNYYIYVKTTQKNWSNWDYTCNIQGITTSVVSDEKKGKLYNYNTYTGNKFFFGYSKEDKTIGQEIKISSIMYNCNYNTLREIYKTNTYELVQGDRNTIGEKYGFTIDGKSVKEIQVNNKTLTMTYQFYGIRNRGSTQIYLNIPIFLGIRPKTVTFQASGSTSSKTLDTTQVNSINFGSGSLNWPVQVDADFIYIDFSATNYNSGTSPSGTYTITFTF